MACGEVKRGESERMKVRNDDVEGSFTFSEVGRPDLIS